MKGLYAMHRRNFLRATSIVCASSTVGLPDAMAAHRYRGCCQVPVATQRWLPFGAPRISTFTSSSPLLPSSGDADFDRALGRQLVRLANAFSVRPGFAYVDDKAGLNALASSETRLHSTQGTVMFGLRFMRSLLKEGVGGDIAVLGVCAHEFAHIHQFYSDDYSQLSAQHDTAKLVELHADYLAGYFLGTVKTQRPAISLQRFADFLYRAGTYDFTDPEFHGTPKERVQAAEQGLRAAAADASFAAAASMGKTYVAAHFA